MQAARSTGAQGTAMRRPVALGVVIALFLVGVAVGALGIHVLDYHLIRKGAMGGELGPHSMASELHRRLALDAGQQRQLDAILADTHREAAALWQEMRPRLAAVIERADSRIVPILRPEQRLEFERYRRERDRHVGRLLMRHFHGASPIH
jgi:hypothetical protein